jgi:hypothetical protein
MDEKLLLDGTTSMLLVEKRKREDIVIGAPHHTPGGTPKMPCPDHTDGDENTGFIASRLAEILDVSSIIACNYHIDSNKTLSSDYSTLIKRWKPKYLIEIHGHGGKKAHYDIEISSGRATKKRNKNSIKFATTLRGKMDKYKELKTYTVSGDFGAIYYKATISKTITTNLWTPFHIELPPPIRKDTKNNKDTLSKFIDKFIICLKETIDEVCK